MLDNRTYKTKSPEGTKMYSQSWVSLMVLALMAGVQSEYTRLEWSDCGTHPDIVFEELNVSPMPVIVPGNMTYTMRVSNRRQAPIGRMIISISAQRKSWINIPIPCMFNIGSCTYYDSCTLLESMQRENWAGIMGEIGRQIQAMLTSQGLTDYCSISNDRLDIDNYVLKMPGIPSILAFIASGDYESTIRAVEHATGQQLICLNVKMTMRVAERKCDWFCRFRNRFNK